MTKHDKAWHRDLNIKLSAHAYTPASFKAEIFFHLFFFTTAIELSHSFVVIADKGDWFSFLIEIDERNTVPFFLIWAVKQWLNCNGISPSHSAGGNYREFLVLEGKQGAQWLWPSLCKDSAREVDGWCCKIEVRGKIFFFCVCECIKAQLTRLHSASLVIEPCSETAAQLECKEMEECVSPRVTGREHTHEIHEAKISRSCSTPKT